MGRTKKNKQGLEVRVSIPDDKHMLHLSNAYGIVCMYRQYNKVPHESMERWLLRLVMEGANAIYQFHNDNIKKSEQATTDGGGTDNNGGVNNGEG